MNFVRFRPKQRALYGAHKPAPVVVSKYSSTIYSGGIFMSNPQFRVGDLVAAWQPYEYNGIIIDIDEYIELHDYESPVTCYCVYWPSGKSSWYLYDELILMRGFEPRSDT